MSAAQRTPVTAAKAPTPVATSLGKKRSAGKEEKHYQENEL